MEITALTVNKYVLSILLQGHTCPGSNYSSFKNDLCCTFLCWVHRGNRAERPLPSIIISPHFHFERREGWDGVVTEDVTGHSGCGDSCSRPCDHTQRSECDDVAKALTILQFLRNRLGAKHKTTVILKCIQTKKQTRPSLCCSLAWAASSRCSVSFTCLFLAFTIVNTHHLWLSFYPARV